MRLPSIAIVSALLVLAGRAPARGAEFDTVSIGGGSSFITYVGENKGFFAKCGIRPTFPRLPSSDAVRDALASGAIQVADFGVDNALAMAEDTGIDIVVVMGIENSPVQFVGAKGMTSVQQLRGKTILVDDPNTQNAVIMKRLLAKQGLEPGRDYQMRIAGGQPFRLAAMRKDPSLGGTMVSWPDFFEMKAEGYPSFGSSLDTIGPMTFHVIFTRRDWAAQHKNLLIRFLTAEVMSLRWAMNPESKADVVALLAKSRGFTPQVAAAAYEGFMGPNGWAKEGEIRRAELANVMKLRTEVEGSRVGAAPAPERYLDMSYLREAISDLAAGSVPVNGCENPGR